MGGDGGSTNNCRVDMVRNRKSAKQEADPYQTACARWRTCALSNAPLEAPVVSCELGYLYNKTKVIEFLIDKKKVTFPDHFAFSHLGGLKDVTECKLSWNQPKRASNDHVDDMRHVFACPVSRMQANGRYPFVLMRSCGCVLAKRALDEVKDNSNCLYCSRALTNSLGEECITLNPSKEELDVMRLRMDTKRLAERSSNTKAAKQRSSSTKEAKISSSQANKKRKHDEVTMHQPYQPNKKPGPSINTQYQSSIAPTLNPKHTAMWLNAEEIKRIPGLTSTKIPTALNQL